MVFQSALSFVLNKYLGEFVENLDQNQLNVGIWGGDIELKNLVIKPAALEELDLPIQCVYGKIGKLVLKIPWKSLYTERTVITVEDIYLLVHPNQQVKYDQLKEEKQKLDFKRKEIERVEEIKRIAAEKLSGKAPAKQGWTAEFSEKLVTTVIKNLQLNISRIHIRYEDKVTKPSTPFAFGITLDQLVVESTDSDWKKVISEDLVKIFKILYLENLAIYLNCNCPIYADFTLEKMLKHLNHGIASQKNLPEGYTYIVGPINAEARLKMNQKPNLDHPAYSIPKFHLNLQMETLYVGLSKCQYQNVIALVDSMERMERSLPFRKFRPNLMTYKGHYREWWHFAIDSVLEYEVRRKKREWDWNHIRQYRNMCKEYKNLFNRKLHKKLKDTEVARFNECEKVLDLTNLIIIRQEVQAEERRETVEDEKKGWLNWIWGSSSQSNDNIDNISTISKLKKEMTPEEKQHLYQAIGYQENASPVIYPEHYIDIVATFVLKMFTIELSDVTVEKEFKSVFKCDLNTVKCRLETRPAGQGLGIKVKIDDFTGIGLSDGYYVPYLISSEASGGGLLDILYEKNPIDKKCDQRIHVTVLPLRIIYDAKTINRLVNIFTIPPDSSVSHLQDAAVTRMTEIKEMSSLGLQYTLEKHQVLDIKIDLKAPYLIMPYEGKYTGSENVIVVDLGNLKIFSHGRRLSSGEVRKQFEKGLNQTEILNYMMENAYDKFDLVLNNLQIIVAQSEEDWKKTVGKDTTVQTNMHLLQPVSLAISFSKCLISDDPRLPRNKILAEIPSIHIVVSDARLMLAISLLTSIEFPATTQVQEEAMSLKVASSVASLHSMLMDIQVPNASLETPSHLVGENLHDQSAEHVEFTLFLATFVMSEFSVTILTQELISDSAIELAKFKMNTITCEMNQFTSVINVEIKLVDVELEVKRGTERIKIIDTLKTDNRENSLFNVVYKQVDTKCPDIHSLYHSCENSLDVNFGSLNLIIHKEAILTILQFYSDINDHVLSANKDKFRTNSSRLYRTISTSSSVNIIGEQLRPKKTKGKNKRVNETIKFKLDARLEEVCVKFCSDAKELAKASISKLNTVVITKETYIQINLALGDLSVLDLNQYSVHKQILSRLEGEALSAQIVMNVIDPDDTTSDLANIDVKVELGQTRILFLNWFITNVLTYLNQFQVAQEAIMDASAAAAEAATSNVKDAYQKAQKVALNIKLSAPVILVPINSRSYDVLLLDLGVINLKNSFLNLDIKHADGYPVVVDDLAITLKELKISRATVDKNYDMVDEHIILEPTNLDIFVKRNLSTSWYTSIPDIDVSGKISKIQFVISNVDYQGIMHILNGNLAEGVVETVCAEHKIIKEQSETVLEPSVLSVSQDLEKAEVAKKIWLGTRKPKPHISLKFTFLMDQFIITMFYQSGATIKSGVKRTEDTQFARFSLEGFSLKGKMLSDNSLVTSILLLKCILDDIQPNRTTKLNRIIDKSPEEFENVSEKSKSMIDITYQQKNDDTFVDVRIFSFTFVVSMDYLMKFADYFKIPEQETLAHLMKASEINAPTKTIKQNMKDKTPPKGQMTLNLKLEKPDIILVEHMEHVDAKAIIFSAEILIKFRQAGAHQVINGVIKECELYRSVFNPKIRIDNKVTILHPLDVSLAGSTPPDQGLHLELLVTNVYINVSPTSIELLNNVMASLNSETSTTLETDKAFEYEDLWNPKSFKGEEYWFLNTEFAGDVLELLTEPKELLYTMEEICIVSIPLISVVVEAGGGNKSLPLIVFETGFKGTVKNWSNALSLEAILTMQMGYYNNKLAMWEPLIEPEVINERTHVPWELKVEVAMNESLDDFNTTSSISSELELQDSDNQIELPKPNISIGLFSEKTLELTISKTLLEMVDYLQKTFSAAMDKDSIKETKDLDVPFRFINELGEDITLNLEESSFTHIGLSESDANEADIPLQLKEQYKTDEKLQMSKEMIGHSHRKAYSLKIQINSLDSSLSLPVVRADKRYFPLNYRSNVHENWGIISDITVVDAITHIVLRSIIQVHNHFDVPIDVYFMTSKGNQLQLISQIQPKAKLNVPLRAVYTPTTELFFGVPEFSVTAMPFAWKDLQTNLKATKVLKCYPKNMERENVPFIIEAVGEMEQVYFEQSNRHTMTSSCYNIHLKPGVTFMNSLPVTIVCCVDESPDEFTLEPGETLQLPTVEPGTNFLVLRIPQYLEKDWSCRKEIISEPEEFSVWTFKSYDSASTITLDLGMHVEKSKGALVLTLYCPFWMINKTGLMISYRSVEDHVNVLYHPPNFEGPILFSFSAKNFFGKKKASIRIENGHWSDKFSIDVAGSAGVVSCKFKEHIYQVGVQNKLTYNGLTKQITFVPYYIIINEAPFAIECQENSRPADPWIVIGPKSCSPLWPKDEAQDKLMKIRAKGTTQCSAPFMYTDSHTTLLRLDNKYGGLNVDIQLTEGSILINVAPYEDGSAPALLINHSNLVISYWEKESIQKRSLEPNHSVLYTWENPSGPREIVWDRGNKKEIIEDLRKDKYGEFSPDEGVCIYWTSFLDGMQRVLLFTEDRYLAENAQASTILEQVQQEITVAIHGIGVSLVNNVNKRELMYVGIASSGVIWETARLNSDRFKYLDKRTSDLIEDKFQECVRNAVSNPKSSWFVKVDSKTDIDFKNGRMHKPQKRKIRRTFLTGLWLHLKSSPSQMQVHAKINRLQIDNQLYDCFFPVVLAPVPLPKSVASDAIKPFIEVSIVQLLMKNSQIRQFKYFKILVQEFHIKMDIGFVNALVDMFAEEEVTPDKLKQQFLLDRQHVRENLYKLAATESIQQQKSFYDLLHFSPLKIHVSFSLASTGSTTESTDAPPFLNVLLQGLGVTLTDVNDVVFKLAFFERNFNFLTQNQLIDEASRHYIGQFIKQFYVLILGLDVIGNPYGLVLGITKGVEDLFYEPFQGAIQGPGEFVEGLSLGVRSLFGHTVGGAAGAVSKITGAMGKGIAALTFDEDFQRKRRENKNRKPQNAQEGLARSGKGVVMGFYSGVTGVFTKPVEGAKEQGVEGFFKGLGKGAVGLVTRPVSGVVDFASESFDVVKRAAEGQNDTIRLRAPRFLHNDGLLRPYNKTEAVGNKYLYSISKGKYAKTDNYVAHYDIVEEKEVLLLTDRRIAYITHSEMFGNWQFEWNYTWDEITSPAKVSPKGVLIQFAEKRKKVFSSGEFAKMVLIPHPKIREEICEKIESLRGT